MTSQSFISIAIPMHSEELPYLLWFTKAQMDEALFHLYKHRPTAYSKEHPQLYSKADIRKHYQLFSTFIEQLEYLSIEKQTDIDNLLSRVEGNMSPIPWSKLPLLEQAFLTANPSRKKDRFKL